MNGQSRWLKALTVLWGLITIFYALVVIGLLAPIPIGVLVLLIANYTGFAIPQAALNGGVFDYFLMVVALAGVILSYIALKKVKKNWRWSFSFIGLSILSWLVTLSNLAINVCVHQIGDGGIEPGCAAPPSSGTILSNIINSAVVLAIAIAIFQISKAQQQSNSAATSERVQGTV